MDKDASKETCQVWTSEPDIIYCLWVADVNKAQSANKNGKKADSGSSSGSFFTWFIVLALLGVWTSVAVVYFDLVDYQGVVGKYLLQHKYILNESKWLQIIESNEVNIT